MDINTSQRRGHDPDDPVVKAAEQAIEVVTGAKTVIRAFMDGLTVVIHYYGKVYL
jgi:hypothetical protein